MTLKLDDMVDNMSPFNADDELMEHPTTPITEETFKRQSGWIKEVEEDDDEEFWYWYLPLPKDTRIKDGPCLLSTANDEWDSYSLKKGEYIVRLYVDISEDKVFELGICTTEEEIEILYRALVGDELI